MLARSGREEYVRTSVLPTDTSNMDRVLVVNTPFHPSCHASQFLLECTTTSPGKGAPLRQGIKQEIDSIYAYALIPTGPRRSSNTLLVMARVSTRVLDTLYLKERKTDSCRDCQSIGELPTLATAIPATNGAIAGRFRM
jgi:hypothetical protein